MEVFEAIKKRKSVRHFKEGDSISPEDMAKILEAARWAPSARNLQPLEFIHVTDPFIKKGLASASRQDQPEKAPLVIAVIGDLAISKLAPQVSSHDTSTEYKATNVFIYMDAAAAIQNMLLTATAMGIDSLWVSSFDEEEISQILKLPKTYVLLAILCFGHRSKPPFSPSKRSIQERFYTDHYESKSRDFSYLEECKLINRDKED